MIKKLDLAFVVTIGFLLMTKFLSKNIKNSSTNYTVLKKNYDNYFHISFAENTKFCSNVKTVFKFKIQP